MKRLIIEGFDLRLIQQNDILSVDNEAIPEGFIKLWAYKPIHGMVGYTSMMIDKEMYQYEEAEIVEDMIYEHISEAFAKLEKQYKGLRISDN